MSEQADIAPLILFVDDEATAVKYFQRAIDSLATVATAASVDEGKQILDQHAQTLMVVISDQRMPGGYGNELLQYAQRQYPHMVRILTTAYSELDRTIEAVNQGQIHRYIQKPWEITALRMEMQQALRLATLHKEHAQLLREKLLVMQKQVLSNRIAALYTLCATLAGTGPLHAVESYLSAAVMSGTVQATEPDWMLMDYADLVSAEAYRSAQFGHEVKAKLAEISQRCQDWNGVGISQLVSDALGISVQAAGDATAIIPEKENMAEFLTLPINAAISQWHAAWLAFLIWLDTRGWSARLEKTESGMSIGLEKSSRPMSQQDLAEWIARLPSSDEKM